MTSPSYKHPLFADLDDAYELVTDLWEGTQAMRDAGTVYLPREPEESLPNYNARLDRTVLFPAYKNAVLSTVGKLYTRDIVIENATPQMLDLLENIDEDNNNIEVFAQAATRSAIQYGCSYVLIDYPITNTNGSLADEIASGAQPYWVLIDAPQVLEASAVKAPGGKNVLGRFRFMINVAYRKSEYEVEFRETVKEFVKQDSGIITYSVQVKVEGVWKLEDSGVLIGMDEIPVVPIYTNKEGFYLGSPMFIDLAYENVLNWQIQSDHQNIVHMSSVPMLMVKGVGNNFDAKGVPIKVVISPNTVLEFSNPDADVNWVEVSGSASDVSKVAIEGSFERMAKMSLEALNSTVAGKTATEIATGAEESNAIIRQLSDEVGDAFTLVIDFTYKYLAVPNPGTEFILQEPVVLTPATSQNTQQDTVTPTADTQSTADDAVIN